MEIRSQQHQPARSGADPSGSPAGSTSESASARTPAAASDADRRRWDLLLSLLDDDSPVVRAEVRSQFERAGRAGARVLRRALDSGAPRIRARARQLLVEQERRRVVRRLVRRAAGGIRLESGLFLLDNHSSPRLDVRPYRKALDAMADRVRKEAHARPTDRERAQALIDVLSGELCFRGAVEDFHHPDNISLWRTIERRRGMPLTLCAIYSFVARRAGLEASLLPFPGHVLLRLELGAGKPAQIVDPFGGGQVLSESQCLSYLSEHRLPYRSEWFQAAPDEAMFERHVRNLVRSLKARGRGAEARELGLVLATLARRHAPESAR